MLANVVVLGKLRIFLCLRLFLIHKLGIPISKDRQNLVGTKGVHLTYTRFLSETGCRAETCTTPGDSKETRESSDSTEVTHVVEPTTMSVVGNTTSHGLS